MTPSETLLTQSKYYPQALKGVFPTRPEFFSVDPLDFEVLARERIEFSAAASNAIRTLANQTEAHKREYTIILAGEYESYGCYFFDYNMQQAAQSRASYAGEQKVWIERRLMRRNGEVIYGHSHVAKGSVYNKFSLTDLHYYVKRSLETKRDVYAMLITKDGYSLIMYSYKEHEFFRVLA